MARERAAIGKRGTIRVSMEVSPEAREVLEDVRHKSRASCLTDAFRRSLQVFSLLLNHVANGGKVVLEKKDGSREVMTII